MNTHHGTWALAATATEVGRDSSDLVFVSATPVSVLLTIIEAFESVLPVTVRVNGSDVPDGTLEASETSRTFLFADVTSIHLVVGAVLPGYDRIRISGTYEISLV